MLRVMWICWGTRPENSMNKFSSLQGMAEFNLFLLMPMDSLLYKSGHDLRNIYATWLHCFPYTNCVAVCLWTHFLIVKAEMAIALGKLSPDDTPLGKPKGMLLKIQSGSGLASKVFDVSGVTMNSGFSRRGCCLSNAPCDWLERVTEVHDYITNLHNCPKENDSNHKSLKVMQMNR